MMMDFINPLIALVIVDAVCTFVCFRHGKTRLGVIGLVGLPAAPLLVWFPLYGALTGPAPQASPTADLRPQTAVPPATEPDAPDPVYSDLALFSGITRFLDDARRAGAIDQLTHDHLVARLHADDWAAGDADEVEPSEPEIAAGPVDLAEVGLPPRRWEEPSVAMDPPPPVAPFAPARASAPTPPPPPGEFRQTWNRFWEAISSEMALHGFAYLGVLMTFVAVFGFLLFAFVDIPDSQQPIYELGIAVVFFAWAWFLRKQNAVHVAAGMELMGGMVLPLALFASLVDNAPIPPDFEGRALVVALTVTSLILALAYTWHGKRHTDSTLRYLVAPLVWLAGLVTGFWFKTDELLTSDAITRLVSPQPAMAAAAIALTLVVVLRNREHRLAVPTVRSALVGLPVAYLLTVSLAVGEDWTRSWPLTLLALSTLVAAELLAAWFDKRDVLTPFRPVVLGLLLVTIAPSLSIEWTGVIVAASYVALFEYDRALHPKVTSATLLTGAGVVIGLFLTLGSAWPALLVSVGLTVWAHIRRHGDWDEETVGDAFTVLAAVAPLATGAALMELLSAGGALIVMAATLATATLAVRASRTIDSFWPLWLTGAAIPVIGLIVVSWQRGEIALEAPLALLIVAPTVGLAPRWPVFRLWSASSVLLAALAIAMETLERPGLERVSVWAAIGVGMVAAAAALRRPPASHLAAIGHLTTLVSFSSASNDAGAAVAWTAWSLGWITSTVASELEGETLGTLLHRLMEHTGEKPGSVAMRSVAWFIPVVTVVSIPFAVVAIAGLSEMIRAEAGVLVALVGLVYAGATRQWTSRRPLSRVLALGAMFSSIVGTLIATPGPWPTIAGCSLIIAVSFVLERDLRPIWFPWVAWVASVPLVILLGDRAGLQSDSLHLVTLAWGGLLLMGGLTADDVLAGRRRPTQILRVSWLWPPVIIGALLVPPSLIPSLSGPGSGVGVWALGAAVFYFAVSLMLRLGAVSLIGHGLASFGVIRLTGMSPTEDPWLLIWLAGWLVVISWVIELIDGTDRDPWLRWDLPPLVVAHGVSLMALVFAFPDSVPETFLAFGALSIVVSVWKRNRAWAEVGNLLIIVAALYTGIGWFALALAGTSMRGIIGTWLTEDLRRFSYQVIGVISAALAWPSFLVWLETDAVTAVGLTAVGFGLLALLVALARRVRWIESDTALGWGVLGVFGVSATSLAAASNPAWIDGPYLAIGLALLALAFQIGLVPVDAKFGVLVPVASGVAWLALVPGLGWSMAEATRFTALLFGLMMIAVAELTRFMGDAGPSERGVRVEPSAWAALAGVGVLVAVGLNGIVGGEELTVGAGAALAGMGLARVAAPLDLDWLRSAAMVAGIVSINSLAVAFEVPRGSLAIALVVLAAAATLVSTSVWRRIPSSVWVTPWLVLAAVTNLQSFAMGVTALPEPGLMVGVLFSIGTQTLAVGLIRDLPQVLAAAPITIALGFILLIDDSVSGSTQWYTVPIGVALLSEVEILRLWSRQRRSVLPEVQIMEWIGLGILVVPGLVEMFTSRLVFGLVPFLASGLLLIWATATRVKRRAVAAATVAIATSVLVLFAAAANQAPDSATFWIVGFGAGFAVMLIAALVEAYRSRRGRTMLRIHELMEGWE